MDALELRPDAGQLRVRFRAQLTWRVLRTPAERTRFSAPRDRVCQFGLAATRRTFDKKRPTHPGSEKNDRQDGLVDHVSGIQQFIRKVSRRSKHRHAPGKNWTPERRLTMYEGFSTDFLSKKPHFLLWGFWKNFSRRSKGAHFPVAAGRAEAVAVWLESKRLVTH